MELDDLKTNWKKETSAASAKSVEQLHAILKSKASSLLTTVKKKYEKIISIMLGGMLVYILAMPVLTDGFTYPGSVNGFAKAMFFYLVLIIFYWEKLKTISNLELSDNLKERLEQLVRKLKRDRRNEIGFVIALFTGFIIIGRFFYGKGLNGIFNTDVVIAFFLGVVFTGIVIYLILQKHGKKLQELQRYLSEYENAQVG